MGSYNFPFKRTGCLKQIAQIFLTSDISLEDALERQRVVKDMEAPVLKCYPSLPWSYCSPSVAARARSPWDSVLQAGDVKACTGGNCFVVYSVKGCASQSAVGRGVAE